MKSGNRVITYYKKGQSLTRGKPKGCGKPSNGTKIKYKGEADIRIKNCPGIKPRRKSGRKKSGRKKKSKK